MSSSKRHPGPAPDIGRDLPVEKRRLGAQALAHPALKPGADTLVGQQVVGIFGEAKGPIRAPSCSGHEVVDMRMVDQLACSPFALPRLLAQALPPLVPCTASPVPCVAASAHVCSTPNDPRSPPRFLGNATSAPSFVPLINCGGELHLGFASFTSRAPDAKHSVVPARMRLQHGTAADTQVAPPKRVILRAKSRFAGLKRKNLRSALRGLSADIHRLAQIQKTILRYTLRKICVNLRESADDCYRLFQSSSLLNRSCHIRTLSFDWPICRPAPSDGGITRSRCITTTAHHGSS